MRKTFIEFKKSLPLKIPVLAILWFVLIVTGLWIVSNYGNTSGIAAGFSVQFPVKSQLKRVPGHSTLIMLVHPHCPCTRASISELELLMAQAPNSLLKTYVLFLRPAGFTEDWAKTDLWETASKIPGVEVLQDAEGSEINIFNSVTSGQTFLYDAGGRLLFKGGITIARGHSGDNDGRSAIAELLNGGKPEQIETPVFGCPLFNKGAACPMPQ